MSTCHLSKSLFWAFVVPFFLCLPLPAKAAPLPDTGQTESYTETFGEDSDYLINPPSYTKLDSNGDELADSASTWAMVKDNVTGLIWEKKTDDGSIHDKDNLYTWDGASDELVAGINSAGFGGHSDWRFPSIEELASISYLGAYSPAVDTVFFPETLDFHYWSSTVIAYSIGFAWTVKFIDGGDDFGDKRSASFYVRAVRGGESAPGDHLVVNGDGTVTDTATGLMWEGVTEGTMSWEAALTHCEGLALAGYDDWRLPNWRELRSLADYSRYDPAADTDAFPDTISSFYWSSTTYDQDPDKAWVLSFYGGYDLAMAKTGAYYLRAVRGGQSLISGHLVIRSPDQGSVWELGDTMPITWDTQAISGNVEISISRQGGKAGTFTVIAAATENDGSYDWTVVGDATVNAVLKIVPLNDSDKATTQGLFSIADPSVPPTVLTASVSSISTDSALAGGDVTSDGGAGVTARGVCWSSSQNPTLADSHTSDGTGTGSFTSSITGLSPGTTYHVRAYATNRAGTAYGADTVFKTAASNTIYVKADGVCAGYLPCYPTIQAGIAAAGDGDTLLVAKGGYSESPVLDQAKNLRLLGGWDETFTDNPFFSTVSAMTVRTGKLVVDGLALAGD